MSDRLLAANLIEISYAKNSSELVVFGSRLYHGSYGLGRIIKWIQRIFPKFGTKTADVKAVSEKTRDLFFDRLGQLAKANEYLKKGYKRLLVGKEINHTRFFRAKDMLLSFSSYFDPFMKDMRKERPSTALSFLVGDVDEEDAAEMAATMKDLFEELHFYQKAFSIEEVTKAEIPLNLIRKMSLDIRLNVREEKKISKWFDQLMKSSKQNIPSFEGDVENTYIQTRSMHRFLCKIVQFINKNFSSIDADFDSEVEALESNLVSYGYQIFDQTDYRHIAWRKNIEEGEEIFWNGKTLVLGEILQNPGRNQNEPIVFAVEDEPSMEVVIYHNESWSYLKRFQDSILHCGIKGKEIFGLSAFGRLVIQERLYDSLEDIEWESDEYTLSKADVAAAKPIVQILRGLKDRPFTPIVGEDSGSGVIGMLLPEHFAFNADDKLVATECLVPGRFSFDTLENFAFTCAKENFLVFSHIMQASGLSEISSARKYQKLFGDALYDNDAYKAITCNSSITDAELIKKRAGFFNDVRNHFEACVKANQSVYDIKQYAKFRKLFIKELIAEQKALCPGSILSLNLFSHAIYNVYMITKPAIKKEEFEKKVKEIIKSKNKEFLAKDNDQPYWNKGIFSKKQIQIARKKAARAWK